MAEDITLSETGKIVENSGENLSVDAFADFARGNFGAAVGPGLSGGYRESIPRTSALANTAIAATGVALAVPIYLAKGDKINNVTFVTATTAAGTPTAGFAALYSSAATPALLAQTADFGSTARAANTAYTVALASQVSITTSGIYWVSISFTASTVPTLHGVTHANAAVAASLVTGMPKLAQSHGSSLGATAPATITSGTTVATVPYLALS